MRKFFHLFTNCWLPLPQHLEFPERRTHKATKLNSFSITALDSALNWGSCLDCVWFFRDSHFILPNSGLEVPLMDQISRCLSSKVHSISHGGGKYWFEKAPLTSNYSGAWRAESIPERTSWSALLAPIVPGNGMWFHFWFISGAYGSGVQGRTEVSLTKLIS